jgi:nucleotide-binding universal stress UspA family protein
MDSFDVILFPTDFSDDSEQAFNLACSLARDQFSSLVVVHVLPPLNVPDKGTEVITEDGPLVHECREQFCRLKALAGDIPISFRIVFGYAVGSILNVAHEENADLIVIASHQHSRFHLQLHGSVAEGVLRQAHCPVMILRQPGQPRTGVALAALSRQRSELTD